MGGSAGLMARLLVVAFFIVVGMGVYTFIVKTDLQAAQEQLVNVEKDRDTWKTRLTQYQAESKTVASNLEQCQAGQKDLQAQLEAATAAKKPAGKK